MYCPSAARAQSTNDPLSSKLSNTDINVFWWLFHRKQNCCCCCCWWSMATARVGLVVIVHNLRQRPDDIAWPEKKKTNKRCVRWWFRYSVHLNTMRPRREQPTRRRPVVHTTRTHTHTHNHTLHTRALEPDSSVNAPHAHTRKKHARVRHAKLPKFGK